MGVLEGVAVSVWVADAVLDGLTVSVDVADTVTVGVSVGEGVRDGVTVGEAVIVGVLVTVDVELGVLELGEYAKAKIVSPRQLIMILEPEPA